jgi:diguanylate cyclase (GGDEF)-like protein
MSKQINFNSVWRGPLVIIAMVAILQIAELFNIVITNPSSLYLLAIVYATYQGGPRYGFITTAIAVIHSSLYFGAGHGLFQYNSEDLTKIILLMISGPLVTLIVGAIEKKTIKLELDLVETSRKLANEVSAHDKLKYLTNYHLTHDQQTDLPNRKMLTDILVDFSGQVPTRNFGLLSIDVNDFGEINKKYGRHIGDIVLHQIGARLTSVVRAGDIVARTDGDQFSILLPNTGDEESLKVVAKRLLTILSKPIKIDIVGDILLTVSIGIARFPESSMEAFELLKLSEDASRHAKTIGLNKFHLAVTR